MTAVWLTKNTFLWYLLNVGIMVLVIGGVIALISSIRACRSRLRTVAAGSTALAAFALFVILMDCGRYAYLSAPDPRYQPFQIRLFEQPWGLYASLECLLLCALVMLLWDDARYCRDHLTPDAVRETVDLLPEGICISAPDGTVLLSNLQMNTVCRMMTGSVFSDALLFRGIILETGIRQNGEFLVRTAEGKTWRFSMKQLALNGTEYDRMTAADVTEQYRVTEELREKNVRLLDIRRRMKEVSNLSGDMFIAREEAVARAALHNQLGQILLMGRHYLEHPENTDADMVRTATLEMNRFLLREAEVPSEPVSLIQGEDLLLQALDMMKSIGVEAEICGELPADPARRILLAHAVQECAANTVKHAEGNQLCIHITDHGQTIQITNNGKPPQGTIAESGGLLSLRMSVEEAGGCMIVESATGFSLTIRFPE